MGTYPPMIVSGNKSKRDPSAGDGQSVETVSTTDSGVVLLPEATNATIVKESPSIVKVAKKLSNKARRVKKNTSYLKSLGIAIMFLAVTILIGIIAVESRHAHIVRGLSNMMYRCFFSKKYISGGMTYHVHSDLTGNKYPSTLASHDHCLHLRHFQIDSQPADVIHDTMSQWSVLIQHNESRCLLYYMHNSLSKCPKGYPWHVDERMGVVSDKSKTQSHLSSVVSRLISTCPLRDISCTGRAIATACSGYQSFEVMSTVIGHFHAQRRVRSVQPFVPQSPIEGVVTYKINESQLVKSNEPVQTETLVLSLDNQILHKETGGDFGAYFLNAKVNVPATGDFKLEILLRKLMKRSSAKHSNGEKNRLTKKQVLKRFAKRARVILGK